jgi:D-arabinose 1-dehydrogenase-like Zn-dependent alcohol dehydrogenase
MKQLTRENVRDLEYVLRLLESGTIKPGLIEYPLEQIVNAHRYVDSGRKKGHVAIKVQG